MQGKRAEATRITGTKTGRRVTDRLDSPATACEIARCPNQSRCVSQGTATFLVMGDICTRSCNYCSVPKGTPEPLDPAEPEQIARRAHHLKLNHVVVASVTRDDLPDSGAHHFALVVNAIHRLMPDTSVEIIIHDFSGNIEALKTIVDSYPEVITHNLDTVPRLYDEVSFYSGYADSLNQLSMVKFWNPGIMTKSGLQLGLGEFDYEVIKVMADLRDAGCNALTLGQYLPYSTKQHDLVKYISPQQFEEYQSLSLQMGFGAVRAGSFVRSSYDASEMYKEIAE